MNHQSEDQGPTETLHSAGDHAFPAPGKYQSAICGICGKSMTVTLNVQGPTGFVEAMAVRLGQSQGHLHDRFLCDDRDSNWHRRAKAIREEAQQTASQRLATLLIEEANEIVRTRRPPKG